MRLLALNRFTLQAAVDVLNLHRSTANPAHSRADGADPTKEADRTQRKLVAIMEARLNKLLVRHSEVVNGNSELKESICHMRKQRMTTDDVRRQYESDIVEVSGTEFLQQVLNVVPTTRAPQHITTPVADNSTFGYDPAASKNCGGFNDTTLVCA